MKRRGFLGLLGGLGIAAVVPGGEVAAEVPPPMPEPYDPITTFPVTIEPHRSWRGYKPPYTVWMSPEQAEQAGVLDGDVVGETLHRIVQWCGE